MSTKDGTVCPLIDSQLTKDDEVNAWCLLYAESIYNTFSIKQKNLFNGYFRMEILSKIGYHRTVPLDVINLCQYFFTVNIRLWSMEIGTMDENINPFKLLCEEAIKCKFSKEYWISCQILEYLCTLFPSFSRYHNEIGLSLGRWKELKLAEQSFIKAIQIKPESHIYRWNYGLLLDRQKKYHISVKLYVKASQLDPNEPEYFAKAADCYAELLNYDNAEINYLKAIELDPNNAMYYVQFARLLRRTKQFEKAEEFITKAQHLDVTNWKQNYEMAKYLRDYQVLFAEYFCLCVVAIKNAYCFSMNMIIIREIMIKQRFITKNVWRLRIWDMSMHHMDICCI